MRDGEETGAREGDHRLPEKLHLWGGAFGNKMTAGILSALILGLPSPSLALDLPQALCQPAEHSRTQGPAAGSTPESESDGPLSRLQHRASLQRVRSWPILPEIKRRCAMPIPNRHFHIPPSLQGARQQPWKFPRSLHGQRVGLPNPPATTNREMPTGLAHGVLGRGTGDNRQRA